MGKIVVYKFMSANDEEHIRRIRSIVIDRQLWFAAINTLNDIDEGIFYYANQTSIDFVNKIKGMMCETGVCSFSKGPTIIRDPLMWAFYGDQHRGVALELEISTDWLDREGIIYHKVNYPSFKQELKSGWVAEGHSLEDVNSSKSLEQIVSHFLFQKFSGWKHENEWRMMKIRSFDREQRGFEEYFNGRVRRIICGRKISAETRQKLDNELQAYHGKWIDEKSHIDELNRKCLHRAAHDGHRSGEIQDCRALLPGELKQYRVTK